MAINTGKNEQSLIICSYFDEIVKTYLKDKVGRTVITFFKESFVEYNKNKVLFIEDILNESDFEKIDKYAADIASVVEKVFYSDVDFDGYKLSLYTRLYMKRGPTAIIKYKYAIDKIIQKENKKQITFFVYDTFQLQLSKWLKKDYNVTVQHENQSLSGNIQIKAKIFNWIENSRLFSNVLDMLLKDRRNMPCRMIWLGMHTIKTMLPLELQKDFKLQLLENDIIHKLAFLKYGFKYETIKQKNHKKFFEKWRNLEKRYDNGVRKIASLTRIDADLLPLIIDIDKTKLKRWLQTLCILEDNRDNLGMLFVEQSVVEDQVVAVSYFNDNNLPSIEMSHGLTPPVIYPNTLEVGNTTKTCAYGDSDKQAMLNGGIEEHKITLTGGPLYDSYFSVQDSSKTYEFLLLVLQFTMFFPSVNSYKLLFDQVTSALRLLESLENERLIIKLHPGQSEIEERYISYLVENSRVKDRVEIKKYADLTDLLRRAKIVFNFSSCVGVEALLMKKPLIILEFAPYRYFEFDKFGGCIVVKNYQELEQATQRILSDINKYLMDNRENIENTRQYFSADLKGEGYKNVAAVCRKLCKNSKSKQNN